MSEDARLALVERFFRGTGESYDAVVAAATLGIDRRWKRRLVGMIPAHASRILDLACGTGISTAAIARRFPLARVVGVEVRDEYLALARRKMAALGLRNVELVLARAEDYRADAPFDCIASSYLAKYAELPRLVRGAHAMLREGGAFIAHDFTFPPGRARVALFRLYFFLLQRAGGALLPAWREIYHGLPRLIEQTRWLPELQAALAREGFRDIRAEHLTLYGSAIVRATK
ncbi:MAG TPA: methyltransferase domain-containing protein [Burkholderiales bacterium]|nr:methyltransferase domain-containing protein [Burkholderiales bacterium]